jgi:archaemetzincin
MALAVALLGYACRTTTAPPDSIPPAAEGEVEGLRALSKRLRPLQAKLPEPEPGDWLASHEESGQTFEEWLGADPMTARAERRVIYVQPLGEMSDTQRRVVDLSARFLGLYFQLPVKVLEPLADSVVPAGHQRNHPRWGMRQLHSVYILDEVLRPRLPADAAALIAFTAIDLYPEESWNFVFGQASLQHRVGVWSIYRKGDPDASPLEFRRVLARTLRTATHETGHMFSIHHCTAYSCNLCGSNSLQESDRHPLQLCAECLPKVLFATQADASARYEELGAYCEEQGLSEDHERYRALLEALAEKRDE